MYIDKDNKGGVNNGIGLTCISRDKNHLGGTKK